MLLRGAGRAADAVTPRASAEKHDDIPRYRALTHNLRGGRRTDDGTDLHALCEVSLVIDFMNLPGRKPDLVAV